MVRNLFVALLFILLLGAPAHSDPYISFEEADGWSYDAVNGWFEKDEGGGTDPRVTRDTGHGTQTLSFESSGWSGRCAKTTVTAYGTDGMFKIYPLYKYDSGCVFSDATGYDRAYFYTKIPMCSGSNRYTFHWGTYTKDPLACDCSSRGSHFYHYYEDMIGSDSFWIKVYVDSHPQHNVVGESVDPGNEPVSSQTISCEAGDSSGWDYWPGMTRSYWQMAYSWWTSETWPGQYDVLFDEFTYFKESRPNENVTTINNVYIEYWGSGHFRVNWQGPSNYTSNSNRYEVKYAYTSIDDDTDWAAASYPSDMPTGGYGAEHVGSTANHYSAEFTVAGYTDTQVIYFAIKDIYDASEADNFKRVDYQAISGSPSTPSLHGVSLNRVNMR